MIWDRTNRPVWLRCVVGVLIAVLAAAVRLQFLEVLELRAAFLTFYPAVAVAALYGGLGAGLLATVVSAALADYFWIEPVGQFAITNPADLISIIIFLASCTLISYVAETAFRAQARAHRAEEQSKLAAERMQAEVLLQRQAELLHLSYDAIIVWRLGGGIESWNKGAEVLYGYSLEEAVGRVTHDLLKTIHPEPWPQIETRSRERKFWEGEVKHRTRDGREVVVSARHQLVRGADGVERVLETNRDITEHKLAEEALRESHERFQVTLNSIGDAVIATDASGNVSFLNPVAAALTGWQSEDAFGQPIESVFRIINEKTRKPAENIVGRVLSDGRIVSLANHTALITREGREVPIEDSAAPIKDGTGKVIGVVLVFHDVTEKRRAREALYESEERLRLFIGHAPASLAMFDREMRYLSASRRWLTDFNLGQTGLTGLSHYEVFPEITEYWKEVHRRGLAGEVVRADADRFDRADGSFQWLRWEVRPWYDATGAVGGIVIFSEDITERQHLLEKIESAARFPDENPNPVLRISRDGELLYANRSSAALLRSLGSKAGETLPDDWRQLALQTFSSGSSKEMELTCEEVVYSLLLVPVSGMGYLNIYGRDITNRKQAEALLQRQAELLHLSYDAIIVWQLGGGIDSWNKGAEELYGYSLEEAVGRVTHDLLKTVHPEPWPQIEAKLQEHKFWEGELKHSTREGREVVVSARIQLVRGADGVERVLETNRDITERKQMEMERAVTVELLKIVNQSSGMADMVEAAITFFQKQSGCEAVGIRLNEGEDFPYFEARGFPEEFVHLENSLCPRDAFGNIIRDSLGNPIIECMCGNVILGRVDASKPFFSPGGSFRANDTTRLLATTSDEDRQTRTRNRCNGEGYESVALIPLHLGAETLGLIQLNDRRKGMFSAETIAVWERLADHLAVAVAKHTADEALRKAHDELELRVQERTAELKTYMARLEQSNQALKDFAGIASHDLQEPLRKVAAFGNMLKQKCGDSIGAQGNDYLDRILNANRRMQSLLTALLEYSRLSTKSNPFVKVNLSDLLGEVLSDLEVRIVRTGGEVHVGDLPVISADPTQMRQLFQNLIGNALKFHKPGDKPVVQVHSVSNTDSACQIVVEDNGIGFDEQYLEKIFAPFMRLHVRSEYEGTGMGLAICKKIVERHGGSITAKSTPGAGALFVIDLPARQAGLQEGLERA